MKIEETKVMTTERMPCGCRWVEPIARPKPGTRIKVGYETVGGFVPCEHHGQPENMTPEYREQAVALVRRQNEKAAALARAERGA